MEPKKNSPIIVLAYKRPEHLSKVLQALQKDPMAKESEIYLFVDGLPSYAAITVKEAHQNVVRLTQNLTGFLETHICVHNINKGVFASMCYAIEKVLEEHDRFIYLEEDIVPKAGYLEYMNKALELYKDNLSVYAINGYAFAEVEKFITQEVYTAYRFCPWGFATWKHQWESVNLNLDCIKYKKYLPWFWYTFNKWSWGWGWTLFVYTFFPFIRNKIEPWDILFCLNHYKKRNTSIWFKESLVNNIGLDGSGMHEGVAFQQNQRKVKHINSTCFIIENKLNLEIDVKMNHKISKTLAPMFRNKMFKTAKSFIWK